MRFARGWVRLGNVMVGSMESGTLIEIDLDHSTPTVVIPTKTNLRRNISAYRQQRLEQSMQILKQLLGSNPPTLLNAEDLNVRQPPKSNSAVYWWGDYEDKAEDMVVDLKKKNARKKGKVGVEGSGYGMYQYHLGRKKSRVDID
ncbi:hypothetical protein HDV05_001324 [Chytridiales sp. JEL 0842]|nr:hypothetical protein HDV05_001324 [Chytridiales sp. JEL 0842]